MTRFGITALVPALCFGLVLLAGCGKKDATPMAPPEGGGRPGSGGGPPGGFPVPPGGMPNFSDPKEVLAKLPGGEEYAAGKKVYADNTCAKCHKLGETGGKGPAGGFPGGPGAGGPGGFPGGPGAGGPGAGGPGAGGPGGFPGKGGPPVGGGFPGGGFPSGPDLTTVGADPKHTEQWLKEQIRDAKKHSPDSKMPSYPADKISDADLDHLVKYLASRKEGAAPAPPPKDGGGKVDGKNGKDDGKTNGKDDSKKPGTP
jgi:hypothetical protein